MTVQVPGEKRSAVARRPAVAGTFYPGSQASLQATVDELLAAARGSSVETTARPAPAGLLVPHAGLVYSGVVAAAAWVQLAGGDPGLTVVLLGTNHGATWLDGIGAWETGEWLIPTGSVAVDEGLAADTLALGAPFRVDRQAHAFEHSIEVQLPLLHAVAPQARILPLAVSTGHGEPAIEAGRHLGELLRERREAGEKVCLAISSDMAHYPSEADCRRMTEELLPSILATDARGLADHELQIRVRRTEGLACGMCGIEPAVLGLSALRVMGATAAEVLASATSADAGGAPDRAVGYLSVRFDE
jgi:AmmeMemoRadiSam system protein B